jgi:hypothetical protein
VRTDDRRAVDVVGDLVPPRPEARLATSAAPCAAGEAEDRPACGVSRRQAGRGVLRHRGRCTGGPAVSRGRRAPSTRGSQPVGILRDVPVTQRGRMTFRRWLLCRYGLARALKRPKKSPDRVQSTSGQKRSGGRVPVPRSTLAVLNGENSRATSRPSVEIASKATVRLVSARRSVRDSCYAAQGNL